MFATCVDVATAPPPPTLLHASRRRWRASRPSRGLVSNPVFAVVAYHAIMARCRPSPVFSIVGVAERLRRQTANLISHESRVRIPSSTRANELFMVRSYDQ